ncbi:hypothetical protein CHH60_18520, partial [Paenibacillus sp. 7523-1]
MPNPFVKSLIVLCLMFLVIPTTTILAAPLVKDPVLAQVIRTDLKLSGKKELKASHLKKLKSLYAMDAGRKISSLQGLEYAVNVVELVLPGHKIKNIKPLSKLTKINLLALDGNQITDLSP